ncbi:MAG: alpha-galactosidase, partial [Lachnospiraceae bacterium]|nr:alpha-galactosidase [Lachnospiraceae bacterium]
GGLKYLVSEVNKLGLRFGIWMEPEMVCPDSDLYRAHPDWALKVPGRTPGYARNQLVLDITRPEVWDYCYGCIKDVLSSANIEYLKWDMNRPLADIYSAGLPADRQGEFHYRYMLALYRMQERLISDFPELLLENCSSGGGRYDAGTLFYSPQVWASDDTDAIERLKIQEGNMLIYPLSTIGAHVSDCPNHGNGRITPFDTRGNVALFGTFGYELDITKISEDDRAMIPGQIDLYHKYNDLIREGDYYRIASFSENGEYDCWSVNAKDASEVLVAYVSVYSRMNRKGRIIRLQGLDPDRIYRIEGTKEQYYGDTLMNAGLQVPEIKGDFRSKLIHLISC